LIEHLEQYRKWCLQKKFSKGKSLSVEDYIFLTDTANPIGNFNLQIAFDTIYKTLDIIKITPHGLRHTHATILLMSTRRIPVAVIAQRLGNTSQMINEVYGHVIEDMEIESVESFDDAINL
jgi:integrase